MAVLSNCSREGQWFMLCIIFSALFFFADGKECKKINSCSCQQDDGGIIDLSPISKKDGTAWFSSVKDTITIANRFYWNPCISFTEEACVNVAVCREESMIPNSTYYDVGTQDSAFFIYRNDADLVLGYQGVNSTTIVTLYCTGNAVDNLTVIGESIEGSAIYNMELRSIHACAFYPIYPPSQDGSGLSAGWVVFIVLLVLLCAYFLVGTVYNIVYKKAEGADAIPHIALIMGGCSYVKGCCSKQDKSRSQYSSV
ncbi:uncharacterized protein LOC110466569 [Mizuhopecten yessoensis]|uniref:Cation-dependent mannose-6-phosphate receptor n=1 Tax=Mizuhopecten yessoensis TaxID=6573 RepID=A0A210PNY4_MIZYE|nr:uncharacterized protein LOC110466569 [Mizuhopecten yessoensis]OWF38201.1 hypothetical protein KP79_PYT19412 [Mizuhopecten yessoensis]